MNRVDSFHDSPYTAVAKLHNLIQAARVDASIIDGNNKNNKYYIDSDTVKIAIDLADKLKRMYNGPKEFISWK